MNYPTQTDIVNEATTYNGWKNYETWNVSLWIQNDEGLYSCAQDAPNYYELAAFFLNNGVDETPDGVSFKDEALDYEALNEVIKSIY